MLRQVSHHHSSFKIEHANDRKSVHVCFYLELDFRQSKVVDVWTLLCAGRANYHLSLNPG